MDAGTPARGGRVGRRDIQKMTERWRFIHSHPAYEVSSTGRVRRDGRLLKLGPNVQTGYLRVNLSQRGKVTQRHVHTLVLEAFRGPRPAGMVACHRDGSRTNNRLRNLRWGTVASNWADTYRHGYRALRGEQVASAKLTARKVRRARKLHQQGYSHREISRMLGVASHTTVGCAIRGKHWGHLK